jgi:hypothetical protein
MKCNRNVGLIGRQRIFGPGQAYDLVRGSRDRGPISPGDELRRGVVGGLAAGLRARGGGRAAGECQQVRTRVDGAVGDSGCAPKPDPDPFSRSAVPVAGARAGAKSAAVVGAAVVVRLISGGGGAPLSVRPLVASG